MYNRDHYSTPLQNSHSTVHDIPVPFPQIIMSFLAGYISLKFQTVLFYLILIYATGFVVLANWCLIPKSSRSAKCLQCMLFGPLIAKDPTIHLNINYHKCWRFVLPVTHLGVRYFDVLHVTKLIHCLFFLQIPSSQLPRYVYTKCSGSLVRPTHNDLVSFTRRSGTRFHLDVFNVL